MLKHILFYVVGFLVGIYLIQFVFGKILWKRKKRKEGTNPLLSAWWPSGRGPTTPLSLSLAAPPQPSYRPARPASGPTPDLSPSPTGNRAPPVLSMTETNSANERKRIPISTGLTVWEIFPEPYKALAPPCNSPFASKSLQPSPSHRGELSLLLLGSCQGPGGFVASSSFSW